MPDKFELENKAPKNVDPRKNESNTGLTFGLETFLCFYQDGELVAIEAQNGHIQRWTTQRQTRGRSLEMFGVDKPKNN